MGGLLCVLGERGPQEHPAVRRLQLRVPLLLRQASPARHPPRCTEAALTASPLVLPIFWELYQHLKY